MPVIVYLAAFAVIILILLAAYRSLGPPASRRAEPAAVLAMAGHGLAEAVGAMAGEEATLPEAGRAGRRLAAGAAAQLSRLDLDPAAAQAVARDLLAAAADDCAWVGRMMEADAYPGNLGMQAAAASLLDHARRCIDEAAPLSATPVGG